MKKEELKKPCFAKGLCFEKYFLIFVIGSIFGTYYEQILTCIQHLLKDGSFVWELRRGVIYGPFSPVYGAGAVLFTFLLVRKKRVWYETILYGGFIGGFFEYMISLLQETFIGTISWDYSGQFLNIYGRTTVPIMLVWGVFSYLFVTFVYPFFSSWIESWNPLVGKRIVSFLCLFLVLDCFISWTALFRQTLRRQQIEPLTPIGRLYDKVYPDSFLEKYYPNMKIGGPKGGKRR